MTDQNLFDQGRAGARHSDNEHRLRVRLAAALVGLHPFAVQDAAQIVQLAKIGACIVFEQPPLERAAFKLPAKGAVDIAAIGIGFAEREMQTNLLVGR
jgi:hypothetical protein